MEISSIFSLIYNNFIMGYIGSPLLGGMLIMFGLVFLMLKYNIPTSGLLVVLFPAALIAVKYGFIQGVFGWLMLVIAGLITALALARVLRQ